MNKNKLRLNESKTQFELFGKPSDLKKIETPIIEIKKKIYLLIWEKSRN